MALATSLAAAVSLLARRTRAAQLVLGLLVLAGQAASVERVYIWRDPSGAVRFSPVRELADRPGESPAGRDDSAPPPISSDSNHPQKY